MSTSPDTKLALVSPFKLKGYLLSSTHPVGSHKSVFFRALGYSPDAPLLLEKDLIALLHEDRQPAEATIFGQKYASTGTLTGPNGRNGRVRAIWIRLHHETALRFVTAFPGDLNHGL
jgi:hypothetical protein